MEYELFTKPENDACPDSTGVSDRSGYSRRPLKVLLAALGFLLLCALVAVCVLGFLYSNRGISLEAVSEQYASAVERQSVQKRNYTELKSRLDEVQMNYENALQRVDSFSELKSQLDQAQANYKNAVKDLESFKEDCQKRVLCEEGWRSLGIKCYYFSTEKLNWTNSRDHCAEKGGHLVIITRQLERAFLYFHTNEPHWIGLSDLETEGKWMWVNNRTLNETGVEFWHERENEPDEPDNWKQEDPTGENCAALGTDGVDTHVWFDDSCGKLKKYICEK